MDIRPILRGPEQAQTPNCSAPAGRLGFPVGVVFLCAFAAHAAIPGALRKRVPGAGYAKVSYAI